MNQFTEFLSTNAALLVAAIALFISLRANFLAQMAHKLNVKSRADADRILLFEKKRENLNELDRRHTRMATLSLLTAQKIMLFREDPELHETMASEFARLKANLDGLQTLASNYEKQRNEIAAIDVGADIAAQDEMLANVRRLTIHLEKDIAHEQADLEEMRKQVAMKNRT